MMVISRIDPDHRRLAAATHAADGLEAEFFVPAHRAALYLQEFLNFFKVR